MSKEQELIKQLQEEVTIIKAREQVLNQTISEVMNANINLKTGTNLQQKQLNDINNSRIVEVKALNDRIEELQGIIDVQMAKIEALEHVPSEDNQSQDSEGDSEAA